MDERSLSDKARGHYNAAVHSKPRGDGKIPNVIRAYYAAYSPNPSFRPRKKVTPTPVSIPVSVFSSVTSSSYNSIEDKDSQTNQLNSKRSYSESNNNSNSNNNNSNAEVNSRNNECNSKIEIYESKKYTGKYYITDPKTNAAVWIEIISKSVNINNNNENIVDVNTMFNINSNIDNFYFIDPKNSLKIGILKAHFIPK